MSSGRPGAGPGRHRADFEHGRGEARLVLDLDQTLESALRGFWVCSRPELNLESA